MATPDTSRSTVPATAAETVGEVMRPGIVTCARSATVPEIAQIMREGRTDCVVVLSNGHRADHFPVVWGIVTEQDLARPLAEGNERTTAEDLAATPVLRARPDLTLAEARSLCVAMSVGHLLVIDGARGAPLGIVRDSELGTGVSVSTDEEGTDHV